MTNGFEVYTNNGGVVVLYIIRDGKAVEAFSNLEMLFNYKDGGEIFRSMIGQIVADPNAYEDWDGAWEYADECSVDDLYLYDAEPDQDHDISTLDISGEYDSTWRCTVTITEKCSGNVKELLGWTSEEV